MVLVSALGIPGEAMQPLLSVLITNFNYGRYLPESVGSALALDYEPKEIVIIDDGSTDDSARYLERFEKESGVRVFRIANRGHVRATEYGLAQVRGDLIYTLDADDVVLPNMMQSVLRVWRDGVSKVQFQLESTDENLNGVGYIDPEFREDYSPDAARREFAAYGGYVSTASSGNVYARKYIETIRPLDSSVFHNADAALNSVAPLYGDVISLRERLGLYRRHGSNQMGAVAFNVRAYQRMAEECYTAAAFVREHCARMKFPFDPEGYLNRERLKVRLLSLKLAPETHAVRDDRLFVLYGKALRSIYADHHLGNFHRAALALWTTAFVLSPRPLAYRLANLRANPKKSRFLRAIIRRAKR
jgi:glycosyltransferase involved in cell wall biosynthesis